MRRIFLIFKHLNVLPQPSCILLALVFCAFSTPQGIQYTHVKNDTPQSIHILEVDPKQFPIAPAKALDQSVGRETVLSLAKRKKALAAINGGYFEIGRFEGVPSGILKIDSKWYGLPSKPRAAIGWKNGGQSVLIDRVLTHLEGCEFLVDPHSTSPSEWNEMEHIVGGTPLLVQNGTLITDFSPEKTLKSFLTKRYARTAIGILPNNHWLFVVVDGKQPNHSLGMTMSELATFMHKLGCQNALNLDGGGSTTLVYEDLVINQPLSEGIHTLCPVSDAILIHKP